ncbi:hypothetical protein CBR_g35004 [Chara braunii]|uniref:Uncharacterized protein n=1 Tax=Chara braunii TaxID=69332 RepID=A0A388LJY8_CHABU|nr:hypothetical protein CBR_g35004 [Chara braunii]|eukprot:GBG82636.1 hypothetical protein CBR_g35004 [Chara braunii]
MNDYEDKAAEISARQREEETTIRSAETELEKLRLEKSHCLERTRELVNERGDIAIAVLEAKKSCDALDNDCSSLTEALELLRDSYDKHYEAYTKTSG